MNSTEKTVGLPQGLPFYRYGTLWKSFFNELGVPVVVSESTTQELMDKGTSVALDETCLSAKIYLGHVESLLGKCHWILIPRIANFGKRKEMCPHFEALYDVTRNTFRSSGQKYLTYEVDEIEGKSEKSAFISMGQELGFTSRESKKAYMAAKKAEEKEWALRVTAQKSLYKTDNLKVFIAAHPYVLEDAFMGKPVTKYLKENQVTCLPGYITDREKARKLALDFSPTCKWEVNRDIIGNLISHKEDIDGIILLSTFPCGSDAMVNDLIMRKIKGVPILNLVLDGQSGTAGIETRLESFIDIIRFKKGLL